MQLLITLEFLIFPLQFREPYTLFVEELQSAVHIIPATQVFIQDWDGMAFLQP